MLLFYNYHGWKIILELISYHIALNFFLSYLRGKKIYLIFWKDRSLFVRAKAFL